MIDFVKQLLVQHFTLIFGTLVGTVVVALLLAIKIFHELRTDPATKKALKEEARFIRALVGIFKKDAIPKPGEPDPLAETAMPFKAVPRPKIEDKGAG
jgi:hypothetical protein